MEKNSKLRSKGASDFTIHKDELRKQRYIARREKRERWGDPLTAGMYSRWSRCNLPSLQDSINDMNKWFRPKGYLFKLRNKQP